MAAKKKHTYIGFNNLVEKLHSKGIKNPAAVAASIGRKKYGAEKFQSHAAKGKSMRGVKPK